MATINRGLFPFLEGAFGKSRKALPEGMSEDGAIKPVAKAPSRWKNAITGGGAAEDAFDVNYRHMEREKNAGLQRELLNQRELGDNERLTTAGAQAVTLEKLRAANEIANLKAKSDETMRPYFTASMYPNGVPATADERTKMMYNYGKYGPEILAREGQSLADTFVSTQKAKYGLDEAKNKSLLPLVPERVNLEHQALGESVRGQVLGNDKLNIDNAMPRKVDAGWNIDPTNGRWLNVENATWGNEATPTTLTRKTTLPTGKELVDTEEVVLNTMKRKGANKITPRKQDPNEINPIEIANEENARAAERRMAKPEDVADKMKQRRKEEDDEQQKKKEANSGVMGLVKKFMKLL